MCPCAQSPDHVQISLAAAMTLGLKPGRFWRNAKLTCINLLQVYEDGCKANCGYCGLARERDGSESFIRVSWPVYPLESIIDCMADCRDAHRVCISMITHPRAAGDAVEIARRIRARCEVPISGLISPTVSDKGALIELKAAGVDKIGVAFDAATPEIFAMLRGKDARGPHRWNRYWECFAEAVAIFGPGQAGSHLIVGLGETEREMAGTLQRVRDLGGVNHLFSFYPESGTRLEQNVPPPMAQYRRVQLAAEIIDRDLARAEDFAYDEATGEIVDFGLEPDRMQSLIAEGRAFMTRGCVGRDGCVACNRPFANSAPGDGLRNYPFQPNDEDLTRIRRQLDGEWFEPLPVVPAGSSPRLARRNPRKKDRVHFFAPNLKHYDTDEFSNTGDAVFVPFSITGESCVLNCDHCEGRLLVGMKPALTPEALWDAARGLKDRGGKGILLTGGCELDGLVRLTPFCSTLRRVKHDLGLKTAVHSKLLDEPLACALAQADCDVVMVDVVGADETLQDVYHLKGRTILDVAHSLTLGERHGLRLAPHIILGAHGGEWRGEYRALNMLRQRRLASLVIAMLMPVGSVGGCGGKGANGDGNGHAPNGNGHSKAKFPAPDLEETKKFFRRARQWFPDTPILLGCARPMGRAQWEIDLAALEAGFDGIAYPADGIIGKARAMGLRPILSELCCALIG